MTENIFVGVAIGHFLSPKARFERGCAVLSRYSKNKGMAALARTPILPNAPSVGALTALSRRWLLAQHPTALDPEATFKIDPMNGRKLEKADFG
jgi:hypothetical protein